MRISDYIEQSCTNLWKMKLRTFLTTFGVVIGIGALVSMISFGKGIQKNVTDKFRELELFNYINVFPPSSSRHGHEDPDNNTMDDGRRTQDEYLAPGTAGGSAYQILDDDFIREVTKMKGVELAFPEIRFPAMIWFREKERFSLIQVLPAYICQSSSIKLRAGKTYTSDDENSLIISDSFLRRMKIKNPQDVVGEEIEISTLTLDLSLTNLLNITLIAKGERLPFSSRKYKFTIAGVIERMGFGGSMPIRSDVFIPSGASKQMKKISLTSVQDFFGSPEKQKGYSMVSIRLSSINYIDSVKEKLEEKGLKTFALIDELEEMKKGFIFLDMFLFAVGMIAIVVASLGIINTMVMSILERYKEIGIMKAVGASDKDVKKIFFFESAVIGFLGGIFGLALGWAVSMLINQVVNHFSAKQGVPEIAYFSFPWWLCLGAVVFSILVSLAAGIYPTMRAARVDPVVALRHD